MTTPGALSRGPAFGWAAALAFVAVGAGCRGEPVAAPVDSHPPISALTWDPERAEVLHWQVDDPAFAQDRALEASGLAATSRYLYVASEKYASVLQVDPAGGWTSRVLTLAVPPGSELEGVAVVGSTLWVCDEAHAAVYVAELGEGEAAVGATLSVRGLELDGVGVRGGKVGLEGLAVAPDGVTVFLLRERRGVEWTGCSSTIYRLRAESGRLVASDPPIEIGLEDCTWRLSALELWRGRIFALKTRYPGEEYLVVEVDPESGRWWPTCDLTALARRLAAEGWSNNLEGLALTADGDLFLVSDNAVTWDAAPGGPPPARERTLLLRVPRVDNLPVE